MSLKDELLHDAILAALLGGVGYFIYREYAHGLDALGQIAGRVEQQVKAKVQAVKNAAKPAGASVVRDRLLRDHGLSPDTYITSDQQRLIAAQEAVKSVSVKPKGYITTDQQHAAALAYLDLRRKEEAAKAALLPKPTKSA
jgi:hypothetical protein